MNYEELKAKATPGDVDVLVDAGRPYLTAGGHVIAKPIQASLLMEMAEAEANIRRAAHCMQNFDAALKVIKELKRITDIAMSAEENPFGVYHNDATDAIGNAEILIAKMETVE